MTRRARIAGAAVYLPERRLTIADTERQLAAQSPDLDLPVGSIERLTGVRYRYVAPPGWVGSDLAAAASQKLLADAGRGIDEIDLIVYAAASADVLEPATAHILADRLGADCPVFDIKNACLSMINGIEVGDALIQANSYRRILLACGESPSRLFPRNITSVEDYLESSAAITMSDIGAALLLEAGDDDGVLGHRFEAYSKAWDSAVTPISSDADGHIRIEGFKLRPIKLLRAMQMSPFSAVHEFLSDSNLSMADFAIICVSQISIPFLEKVRDDLDIPADKLVVTVDDYGSANAASIPLQLVLAEESGRLNRGDFVALIGVGSGISIGIMIIRW
jgi:3-oxoacyl-[acyl-carrier-protein] synthase III